MHIVHNPRRVRQRMYLPSQRQVVDGTGLGELEGFKLKKAFKRAIKFKKSSFKPKNIMGAVGSATMFTATSGLSSVVAPKLTGAHSKLSRIVGIGATAVAGGVGIAALLPAGALAAAGSSISGAFSGLTGMVGGLGTSIMQSGAGLLKMFGGGGAVPQTTQYPEGYAPMYAPGQIGQDYYGPGTPVGEQLSPTVFPGMATGGQQVSYPADMQVPTPYSALADDSVREVVDPITGLVTDPATGNKINPGTGRVVSTAGMIPDLPMGAWLLIGGMTAVGWYFMSEKK
jgi:hypothetical protein